MTTPHKSGNPDWNTSKVITPAKQEAIEAAIDQLDAEKVAKAGDTMTGALEIKAAAPSVKLTDTTAGATGLMLEIDGNLATFKKVDAAGVVGAMVAKIDLATGEMYSVDGTKRLVRADELTTAGGTDANKIAVTGANGRVGDAERVDGIHLRNNAGLLEWSTDGTTWYQAGLPEAKVIGLAMFF